MDKWSVIGGAVAGLVGAAIGAGATIWATLRTLRQQAKQSADERTAALLDEFDFARQRADQQILSAITVLRLSERPSPPFIHLDHDAFEVLLRYPQLPIAVAFELERIAVALRSYNAAAEWGNRKYPMAGAEAPAEARWAEARDLANVAFTTYQVWRGDALAALHPLVHD